MVAFQQDIDNCLDVLQKGGLIVYPTDTVWAIGCDATSEAAVTRLLALRQCPSPVPMVVLMAEERDILHYVAQPDLLIFDYIKGVSKPTTVVYEAGIGLASSLLAEDGSVAIRICTDEFCRHLIKRFRKPIVGTAAALQGYPAPAFFRDIEPIVTEGVDYIVQYRRWEEDRPGRPSSVIRWEKDGSLRVIRS
ncbi:MAG: Sua5/YciO/YrdC/YwlC family protein [Chitinophagaceae bacterium]|jgi:L-threonylcarbamoyladenylate synthase|nr:Sua5/YciO/YrdC/YwlC family protein [Chitinophagaceae bacterium]